MEPVEASKPELLVSTEQAAKLAEKFRATDKKVSEGDPFPEEIPYSLLSAEHIKMYAEATGLVAPFYVDSGRKSRLKKAAYEGRIGNCAYQYTDDHHPKKVFATDDKELKVPANSIVFVECDLEFRLPEFIALRFNLQIQHVHRGLLLGTGPLVDPGFWGKLCIPLHNLTDEDYVIPKDRGLIWLEFTKTTSKLEGKKPIGRSPLGSKEFWDISEFLNKASAQYRNDDKKIPLRSSLPTMFSGATEASKKALDNAKNAALDAEKASKSAGRARTISLAAGFASAVALLALWVTFLLAVYDFHSKVIPLSSEMGRLQNDVTGAKTAQDQRLDVLEMEIKTVKQDLIDALNEKLTLEQRIQTFEAELQTLPRSIP